MVRDGCRFIISGQSPQVYFFLDENPSLFLEHHLMTTDNARIARGLP